MVSKVGNTSFSFGAVGGLLMFPAIPGCFPLVIISILFFFIAYKSFDLEKCKRNFLLISAFNFMVGNALYFTPHADNDGLDGYGLLIGVAAIIFSMAVLFNTIKLDDEAKRGS